MRRYGTTSVHVYTLLAADVGSFTVIFAKAVSTFAATDVVHSVATLTFWVSVRARSPLRAGTRCR